MAETSDSLQSKRVQVPDYPRAIQDYCWKQGWTDGLPIVPPTEPLVREMLAGYGGAPSGSLGRMQPGNSPSVSLGRIQPGNSNVTLEKLAVNAVMAGCLPEHFPVVVAAVKAALRDEFNLAGNAVTTGGAAQVLIVNGPIAKELGINGDAGCFGPGFRANAAIGRALRLVIRNLGGLIPGGMDQATLSTPFRYSFCFSENEALSPWEPRHVELGFQSSASTVTVAAILGVYNVMESTVGTGIEVLRTITGNMRGIGIPGYYHLGTRPQIVLVLCPEHATEIAQSGMSKADVREYIYHYARMPIHQLKDLAHYGNRVWPNWIDQTNPGTLVPIVSAADDIVVVVAGGGGRHSAWMSGWVTRVCTEEIVRAE